MDSVIWIFILGGALTASIIALTVFICIRKTRRRAAEVGFWAAILIALAAPLVEMAFTICRDFFFDPLPNAVATMVYLSAVVGTATARFVSRKGMYAAAVCISTVCIGVAVPYSLYFFPIIPFALLGTAVSGLGVFGLAPILLVLAALHARKYARAGRRSMEQDSAGTAVGISGILLATAVFGTTSALLHRPVIFAVVDMLHESDNPALQNTAPAIAGRFNDSYWSDYLRPGDIYPKFLSGLSADRAAEKRSDRRRLYSIVTGEPVPAFWDGLYWWEEFTDLSRDEYLGGRIIGHPIDGLRAETSEMAIHEYPAYGFDIVEWESVVSNESAEAAEARYVLRMPERAVVTGAWLYIDGEKRQAAFGTRELARRAYEKIVSARRDPILVSRSGPDRILVQCFPVQPGESMKWGVRIAVPVLSETEPGLRHPKLPVLEHANLDTEQTELQVREGPISAISAGRAVFGLNITPVESAPGDRLSDPILVLDGTRNLLPLLQDIDWTTLQITGMYVSLPYGAIRIDSDSSISDQLEHLSVYGGTDPSHGLAEALAFDPTVPLIWLSDGGYASTLSMKGLEYQLRNRAHGRDIYMIQVCGPPHRAVATEDLTEIVTDISPLEVSGESIVKTIQHFRSIEKRRAAPLMPPVGFNGCGDEYSRVVEDLLLADVIRRRAAEGAPPDGNLARQAALARIVTPLSSAVVLENPEQYEAAGLNPETGYNENADMPESIHPVIQAAAAFLFVVFLYGAVSRRLKDPPDTGIRAGGVKGPAGNHIALVFAILLLTMLLRETSPLAETFRKLQEYLVAVSLQPWRVVVGEGLLISDTGRTFSISGVCRGTGAITWSIVMVLLYAEARDWSVGNRLKGITIAILAATASNVLRIWLVAIQYFLGFGAGHSPHMRASLIAHSLLVSGFVMLWLFRSTIEESRAPIFSSRIVDIR